MKEIGKLLEEIRSHGYSVAQYNDFSMNNVQMTFWLFTKNDGTKWVESEAKTDIECRSNVLDQIGNK